MGKVYQSNKKGIKKFVSKKYKEDLMEKKFSGNSDAGEEHKLFMKVCDKGKF